MQQNSILDNSLNKIKSWTIVHKKGFAIVKPENELEFMMAITIVENAIKNKQLTDKDFMSFITKDLSKVKQPTKKPLVKRKKNESSRRK